MRPRVSTSTEEEQPETAESRAATRKVLALVSTSVVSVIDVSSYVMARSHPGLVPVVAIPMAIVTAGVLVFAFFMLRNLPKSD